MALFPIIGSTGPIAVSLATPGNLANAGLRHSN